MSYSYTNGDGLAALTPTEPDGDAEPLSNLDDAIKQVKAFLLDPVAGYAALAASVGGIGASLTKYPFSAIMASPQVITGNDPDALVLFPTENYDVNNKYDAASSKFVAPVTGIYRFNVGVQIELTTGTPTDLSLFLLLKKNGTETIGFDTNEADETKGRTMQVVRDVYLLTGQEVTVNFGILSTGACTWTIDTNSAVTYFEGSLIQAT